MAIYRGPGGAGDATNDAIVNQVASYATQAASSADNAANSASTASTSSTNASTAATNAASSASAAAISASNSAASASTSSTAATTATTQANNAASSATAAANSAASASTYASNASTSAATATSKATEAETYAIRAETAETNAETAYANTLGIFGDATDVANAVAAASTSATNAANSATTAASSATAASGSATTAGNYASAALNSANNANAEASEAQSAANTAVAALQSAQAIYGGLDDVTAAVDDAEAFAVQSANSATASSASSSAAQTSANSAATSATNAANSATQAANSAASAAAIVTGVASNRPSVRPSLLLDFSNTKQLDPRITFSRPTTATYYDGKTTAKAEENLAIQSQTFDNAYWIKSSATVTADATTAPDGTTTADKAIGAAATGNHFIYQQNTNNPLGTFTYSVYAKAAEYGFVGIGTKGTNGAGDIFSYFNLSTGATATIAAGHSASTVSVGSGWYRCIITATFTGTPSQFYIVPTSADNTLSYTGDGTSGIYIWGAQLEQRSTVTAYTPTTSSPITNYIPALQTAAAGVPRFDHDPVTGESKGFLIEEQRSNLLTYSEQFDNAAWAYNESLPITPNAVAAPDGTITGDLFRPSTSNVYHATKQTPSMSAGTAYTMSVYAKKQSLNYAYLLTYDSNGLKTTSFNLSTGLIGTVASNHTAAMVPVGNGWYRCAVTFTLSGSNLGMYVGVSNADNTPAYVSDGVSGSYIWGAQLEAGSFPTSYIPTVASQVTRSADSASMTGSNFSSWFNQAEGTFYSASSSANTATTDTVGYYNGILTANDNTNSNLIQVGVTVNSYTAIRNGATVANISIGSVVANTNNKLAAYYSVNGFNSARNGVTGTATTLGIPPTVSQLAIGRAYPGNYGYITGWISKIAYYPKRLSNAELQGLTS